MRAWRRTAVLIGLLCGATVTSCAGALPRPLPETFRSPLAAPVKSRAFLPVAVQPMNKLGIAGCVGDLRALGASWCYSWAADPGCGPSGEYVPMIWDETRVADAIGGCSDAVLLFNECDRAEQCGLAPADAVKPLAAAEARIKALGKRVGAPAPSQTGLWWLRETRARYCAELGRCPQWDFLTMHCYLNDAAACWQLAQQFKGVAQEWGIDEVWITEVFFSTEAQQREFMRLVAGDPMVTRVAPFVSRMNCQTEKRFWDCESGSDPSLFDGGGNLTDYGRMWAQSTPEGP